MDDPERLIVSAVERLVAAGIRQRAALAKRLGLPTTDVLALHHVVIGAGTAPSDLARSLLLSPSGATAVVDRLARAGLISRGRGSAGRRVVLKATDAGRALHAEAVARLSHDIAHLVEDLPRNHRVVLERFLTRFADLAEREADTLIARAEAEGRAAAVIAPPVLWS